MKRLLSLVLNIFIVWSVATAVGQMLFFRGEGNMQVSGLAAFRYFTVDSNILVAIASAALILRGGGGPKVKDPAGVIILKYMGTTAVTVTMVTVLLFLGPTMGYEYMFTGINLYLHLLVPLAAILSFVFFDGNRDLHPLCVVFSILPTFCYGAIYIWQVVYVGPENGGWRDFYGFNVNGNWRVPLAVMLAGTVGLGIMLLAGHNGRTK